jgi:hypothetical protein
MPDRLSLVRLRQYPRATRAAGLAFGLAALPAIALGHSWIGLVLVAASRAAAFVEPDEVLDAIVLAGLPFAFALADPSRAVAASFSLFGFIVLLAVCRRLDRIEALVCTAAAVVACVFPAWFSLVAYALGIAGFVVAGMRFARTFA